MRTEIQALGTDGAAQSVVPTGSTEALKNLRLSFESALHPLSRAVFRCLSKLGQTEDAAKANLTPSKLHDARAIALAGLGETVLDLADDLAASTDPATQAVAGKYNISTASVEPVNTLWEKYSVAVGAPGGARSKRKALTNALPGRFSATEEKFAELDDLVVQFKGTALGDQFVASWFNARRIIDLGRRGAKNTTLAAPTASGSK